MLHCFCDLCGTELLVGEDHHYVTKIEVYVACNPLQGTEGALNAEHKHGDSGLLEQIIHMVKQGLNDTLSKSFRFELCPECHKKFLKNPLGRKMLGSIDFSKN